MADPFYNVIRIEHCLIGAVRLEFDVTYVQNSGKDSKKIELLVYGEAHGRKGGLGRWPFCQFKKWDV
jgi:hypothetical protein